MKITPVLCRNWVSRHIALTYQTRKPLCQVHVLREWNQEIEKGMNHVNTMFSRKRPLVLTESRVIRQRFAGLRFGENRWQRFNQRVTLVTWDGRVQVFRH